MEKNILGEYDFRNNTAINVSVNYKDQLDITILHETVHMILTRGTKWGLFSYIIRRVQVYDDSYKHIMNYLSEQSRKVQEAIAVFAECIYIINKYGYERYIEYITYLKRNNKKYFNYVKPLIPYLEMINPKEKQCKYTLFEISKLIYGLAYVAMNSEIIEIPSESLKSKKKFKKIISNGEFANKYLPNTRFKSLVRRINDLMLKQKNYNIKDIVKELQVFYMDEHENLDYILNRPQLKYDEMSGYLNKAKSYVRKIYSSSKNFELINSFLEDLKIREISIEDLPQHCIPASFRKYEIVKSEYNDVLHVINKDIGILFYLGNVEYMDDFDTDLLYISSENMGRFKQYSNGDNNCCIYFDYTIKKQYIFNCNNSEMQELISNNNLVVVVNYKFFDAKTSKIIGIERCFNQIYVYCDRTYPNSIDIINSVCKNIAKCRIIEYGSTYLLIIKVSSKIKLILPFLSVAYERVLSDIRNKVLNLELADNPDGVTLFENYIIKQEDDLEVYDLIMNCFFDFE